MCSDVAVENSSCEISEVWGQALICLTSVGQTPANAGSAQSR